MSNEIVKYDNYMNTLQFSKFSATDYDFLMMLCAKLKDLQCEEIEIDFAEIKDLVHYDRHKSNARFISDLKRMNKKLMSVTASIETGDESIDFVLFPTFTTHKEKLTLKIEVNKKFAFILNDLANNFTRFELEEFVRIRNKHGKALYRLLKQWRSTGQFIVSVNDLRRMLDCPKSYTNAVFMREVIAPAVKELGSCFPSLVCNVRYSSRKGTPVTGYTFLWDKGEVIDVQPDPKQIWQKKAAIVSKPNPKNRFNNFEQRQYDYDSLEKQLQEAQRRALEAENKENPSND